MPNHCCNTLVMSESTLPIILKNYIRQDERGNNFFDFERVIPIGEVPDWYEQRNEKWGTKWVGYDLNISGSVIDFFTAWSPPVPIIKKLAELHKDLIFRLEYYETGMAFRGIATAYWKDGEVSLNDHCWNMAKKDFVELGYTDFINKEDNTEEEGGNNALSPNPACESGNRLPYRELRPRGV